MNGTGRRKITGSRNSVILIATNVKLLAYVLNIVHKTSATQFIGQLYLYCSYHHLKQMLLEMRRNINVFDSLSIKDVLKVLHDFIQTDLRGSCRYIYKIRVC